MAIELTTKTITIMYPVRAPRNRAKGRMEALKDNGVATAPMAISVTVRQRYGCVDPLGLSSVDNAKTSSGANSAIHPIARSPMIASRDSSSRKAGSCSSSVGNRYSVHVRQFMVDPHGLYEA
jgi:hypothetical protein